MRVLKTAGSMILLAAVVGCGTGASESGVILIRAEDYAFRAPSTFPSGWVKLRFENQGEEDHFLLVWRLPEGKTFDEWAAEVSEPFQEHYTRYRAGEVDQATFFEKLIAALPEWFYEAVPMGGPGFTAPGRTSETMIYLEPGDNYVLECYVRSMVEDHRFHGSEGMLRPLIVTADTSALQPPEADSDHDLELGPGGYRDPVGRLAHRQGARRRRAGGLHPPQRPSGEARGRPSGRGRRAVA